MKLRNRPCVCVASLLLVCTILCACSTPLTIAPSSSTASLSTIRTSHTDAQAPSPVISSPSPTPMPTPEITSAPTTTSAPPATAALTAPVYTAKVTDGIICNKYSAYDGKYIYYFADDGVRRMALNGSGDKLTKIMGCYEFLHVNKTSLYFIASDDEYKPSDYEMNWQWCNSYNLMVYDTRTQKVKTLKKHLDDVVYANGAIYMIDHLDHSRIYLYGIKSERFSKVTGGPSGYKDYNETALFSIEDKAYAYMKEEDYPINKNKIATIPVIMPDPLAESGFYQVDYTDLGTEISIWTQTGYKNIGIKNIGDYVDTGTKLYITTIEYDDDSQEEEIPVRCSLYMVDPKGVIIKLKDKTLKSDGNMEVWNISDINNGWLFTFWVQGDGGTASGLVLKEKIS